MIKVIFRCDRCGHEKGQIISSDRDAEIECENCKVWETLPETTEYYKNKDTN